MIVQKKGPTKSDKARLFGAFLEEEATAFDG
jgi:hypothetical protein